MCVSDLIHLHPDHWFLAVCGEGVCVQSDNTPSHALSKPTSLSLPLFVSLRQFAGCRVCNTFVLGGVSDYITQRACDVIRDKPSKMQAGVA